MKEFAYIKQSLKWTKRYINKDSTLIIEKNNYSCFFLFDWVSSSDNAKEWIKIIKKHIKSKIEKYNGDNWLRLKNLIIESNNYLLESKIKNWLSTISCIYLSKNKNIVKIVNIGDSRIYGIFNQYKKQLTVDDKEIENSNFITKCLWIQLNEHDIIEITLSYEDIGSNLVLCSDWFYSIFEKNILEFHEILFYKKLWNIRNRLFKEIKGKNTDDSTYIYVIIK